MRTILVGYDETEGSKRALDRAIEFAKAFDARLVITSVVPVIEAVGRGMGSIDPIDPPERHLEDLAVARVYLQARAIEAEYVPAIGDPARTIAGLADERDVDLIVVGTREPELVDRLLHSSVSQDVSRRAP